jgi:hypothetical protein
MVAQQADVIDGLRSDGGSKLPLADRWMFFFMAALFVVTALTGFIPSSMEKLAAIDAGGRPPFPPILHIHALLMGTWLLLLLTQAGLVATDRRALHQKLGIAAMIVAPAMVVTGFLLVPGNYRAIAALAAAPPPGADPATFTQLKAFLTNLALLQFRAGILFTIFVALAFAYRKSDPGTHKRLMILATVVPLPAAIDRINWIPHSVPESPMSPDLYVLLWIAPMFIYDLIRHKRIQRAYVIWFAISLPFAIAVHALWASPWWMATAPKIMGAS